MHVLIVNPASSGTRWITAARALSMRVTLVTPGTGFYALSEAERRAVREVHEITDLSTPAILAAVREVHGREPVDIIVPGIEYVVHAVATVAAELGLPGLDPADAEAVRDKGVMRERLHRAGVRSPRSVTVADPDDAVAAATDIGFPCVVKPADMLGTVGVRRVDNAADVTDAYREIVGHRVPLGRMLPGGTVIVERYLAGPEFSAEGVVYGGRAEILAITEKFLGPEPHFQQVSHLVRPAGMVPGHEAVRAYVQEVVTALRIGDGAIHAEYRVTGDGPVLVEIGVRLPGDRIAEMVEMVTGVCQAQAVLAAAAGRPAPAPRPVRAAVAGIHYVTNPKLVGGSYRELRGWDAASRRPEVVASAVTFAPGEEIPDTQDMRSRIAHLVFTAPDHATAVRTRHALADGIDVVG
ncbi:ATP-grasp domain-containing protein [Yinghuangia sp. ASG 101]|uniref:ATP-grasp domain-containing protein n=1 Tax=Yinghuangia sp. ASG 101 TaxID=2896848 RepID=UPI001E41F5A1|nr:ATP-grasp domain-containing protein [Yinghuangia sp. ASG 101]UGQ13339.1 ATP-grasp domain-containing protein [Yinghuangia sp. ASG 101]